MDGWVEAKGLVKDWVLEVAGLVPTCEQTAKRVWTGTVTVAITRDVRACTIVCSDVSPGSVSVSKLLT